MLMILKKRFIQHMEYIRKNVPPIKLQNSNLQRFTSDNSLVAYMHNSTVILIKDRGNPRYKNCTHI